MKKIILFAACLFAVTTVTQAQEVPMKERNLTGTEKKGGNKLTPEQRAQKSVDELNAEVTLTEDQKPKVLSAATDRITKADAIREKYKTDVDKETKLKMARVIQVFEYEKLTLIKDELGRYLSKPELEKLYEYNDQNSNKYFTGIRDGIKFVNYVRLV